MLTETDLQFIRARVKAAREGRRLFWAEHELDWLEQLINEVDALRAALCYERCPVPCPDHPRYQYGEVVVPL